MATNERGYTFCKGTRPRKGPEVHGGPNSVGFPIACPRGSKPKALFHTHPGGSLSLSPQDIKTMNNTKLPVCVRVGNKVKCYRPKK